MPTTEVFLKPAKAGLIVRDPDTGKPLAEDGEVKTRSTYWIRRIKQGDVTAATPTGTDTAADRG